MLLSDIPRVRLAHLPTPLEPLERLGLALSARPRLHIKRDDCTGLAFGGNKTRKLEFSIGAALAAGADTLVTSGGVQSNHVRQTAAAAARFGLGCHAVLENPLAEPPTGYFNSGNRLLDDLFGVTIHTAPYDDAAVAACVEKVARGLTEAGRKPFIVPQGASDEIGSLGYVVCAHELLDQARELDLDISHVVLSTGSSGTQAGLLTGLRLAGSSARVVGISCGEPGSVKAAKVEVIAGRVLERLDEPAWEGFGKDTEVHDGYAGPGYGSPTQAGEAAIRLLATTEGILLDPVYTGKAMAGLIGLLEGDVLKDARDVVFLHTGGAPALFAYGDNFVKPLA